MRRGGRSGTDTAAPASGSDWPLRGLHPGDEMPVLQPLGAGEFCYWCGEQFDDGSHAECLPVARQMKESPQPMRPSP